MTTLSKRGTCGCGDDRVQVHLLPPLKDQLTCGFIPIRHIREVFPANAENARSPAPVADASRVVHFYPKI